MTQYLTSAALVDQLTPEITSRSRRLIKNGIHPHLAVIVVGEDDRYPVLKQRRGRELGVETSIYRLPETSTVDDTIGIISFLNEDASVHGILIQLPLPATWPAKDVDRAIRSVSPTKDVDGLTPTLPPGTYKNLDDLVAATHRAKHYLPTTAWAMLALLQSHKISMRNALIVGQGRLVGAPLGQLLKKLGQKPSVVEIDSPDRERQIAQADLILAGTNVKQPIFDPQTVKEGVAIVAAGREIDQVDLTGWASWLTPERGGVGPLTVTYLFYQTLLAAENIT